MQYLKINKSLKLAELSDNIGSTNVSHTLSVNNLIRTPNIGEYFYDMCDKIVNESEQVDWQRKLTLLSKFSGDSDLFETVALLDSDGWKVLSNLNTLPGMIKIPEYVTLPDSVDVLGSGEHVSDNIYNKALNCFKYAPHTIDPSIFNEYCNIVPSSIQGVSSSNVSQLNTFQWFKLPWGDITLYSSLSDTSVEFPVYPESVEDRRSANYTTMPDMLYQYEPWQVYQSSGPRTNIYEFSFHRDMWTGDHRDGKANQLIRFCEANCYPDYQGSAVVTSNVTLYVGGKELITGILTDVTTDWDGPIGLDGWYLNCKLKLTITEVSKSALNYSNIIKKPLIG